MCRPAMQRRRSPRHLLREKGRFFGAGLPFREDSERLRQIIFIHIINLKVLFYEQKVFYFDGSGDARRRTVMQ